MVNAGVDAATDAANAATDAALAAAGRGCRAYRIRYSKWSCLQKQVDSWWY